MVALYTTEKQMLKNLCKQSDYDNRYQLLNGKVIQKTLTSHKYFNKFIFSFAAHSAVFVFLKYFIRLKKYYFRLT